MSQCNPKCTSSFDLHIILCSHFYYSVLFGVSVHIRGSKRDIYNFFLVFQVCFPCGHLNTNLLEVQIVPIVKFAYTFLIKK
jgi:hypothetical protein